MSNLKYKCRYMALLICMVLSAGVLRAADEPEEYNRSSLYTITMLHPKDRMYQNIFETMQDIPIPDKYEDHSLNMRIMEAPNAKGKMTYSQEKMQEQLTAFMHANQIGRRMVARWFERDRRSGAFNTATLERRGHYNLSEMARQQSAWTIAGSAERSDADEELIPQTFVIVNDITYVDKEQNAQIAKGVLTVLAAAASAFGGGGIADLVKQTLQLGANIADLIAGFTVDVRSYLFQLEWNEEVANKFYMDYYYTADRIDPGKKAAFEADTTSFRMKYIGTYNARSAKTSPRGVHSPAQVFRKVLTRAIDKNIVELQREFSVFKVTSIISAVSGKNEVQAYIGLKEGVSPNSTYEVLQRELKNGKMVYKRVATLEPKENMIWDNRYMAVEEKAPNAELGYTTFTVKNPVSQIFPGMLVREVK